MKPSKNTTPVAYAIRLLKSRDYTETEIRAKLDSRKYGGDIIIKTVDKLKELGFINDRRYLENYIEFSVIDKAISSETGKIITIPRSANPDFDDVPVLVANAAGWKEGHAKKMLNEKAIRKMAYAQLQAFDPTGEVIGWLQNMIELGDLD